MKFTSLVLVLIIFTGCDQNANNSEADEETIKEVLDKHIIQETNPNGSESVEEDISINSFKISCGAQVDKESGWAYLTLPKKDSWEWSRSTTEVNVAEYYWSINFGQVDYSTGRFEPDYELGAILFKWKDSKQKAGSIEELLQDSQYINSFHDENTKIDIDYMKINEYVDIKDYQMIFRIKGNETYTSIFKNKPTHILAMYYIYETDENIYCFEEIHYSE